LEVSAYSLASRYVGIAELEGPDSHPLVSWWLSLCGLGQTPADSIPWCSAFTNGIAWELRLPRSKSAAARSWLGVGTPIQLPEAEPAFDVVILKRGKAPQPGPTVLNAPGHVGFFAGLEGDRVLILGGNQADQVSVSSFPVKDVLGIRRLSE